MSVSNRDTKYDGVQSVQGGIYDVLIALKSNIMNALNVSTLAAVVSKDISNKTITVRPFPLLDNETSKNITCISSLIPMTITTDDIISIKWIDIVDYVNPKDVVLVVFTNRNSKQNLIQSRTQQSLTTLSNDAELHAETFGVVVSVCYTNQTQEE